MFEPYYRELQAYLTRQTRDAEIACDIAQESYVRVLCLHQAGEAIAEPRALLYRVAKNLLVDHIRRERFRDLDSLETVDEGDLLLATEDPSPDAHYEAVQYAQLMSEVIEGLPARCREAFMLNRFDGFSHDEIACHMGISRNMVAQHIMRAVLVCRACDRGFRG